MVGSCLSCQNEDVEILHFCSCEMCYKDNTYCINCVLKNYDFFCYNGSCGFQLPHFQHYRGVLLQTYTLKGTLIKEHCFEGIAPLTKITLEYEGIDPQYSKMFSTFTPV